MSGISNILVILYLFIFIIIIMLMYFVVQNRNLINSLDITVHEYIDDDVVKLNNVIKAINYNDKLLLRKQNYLANVISNNNNFTSNTNNSPGTTPTVDEEDVHFSLYNYSNTHASKNNKSSWNIFDAIFANRTLNSLF